MRYILATVLLSSGCVSIPTHERGVTKAYQAGLDRAAQFMARYDCQDAKWLLGSEISMQEMREIMDGKK